MSVERTALAPVSAAASDGGEPAEPPQRLIVDVVVEDQAWIALGPCNDWVAAAVAAVAALDCANRARDAVIALADDATVADLNARFRSQAKPTNVLSFPSGDTSGASLGDIILARETVLREAAAHDVPVQHHVQHLVIHGLLHLLGYDHESDADATEMEMLETRLLAALGIPDPYADTDPV